MTEVAVLGSSGFVGRAVIGALHRRDVEVRALSAPRLSTSARCAHHLLAEVMSQDLVVRELAERLHGVQAVVNAAGLADPSGVDSPTLYGANALLPAMVAAAAAAAGVPRCVHISSAAVQGGVGVLDESDRLRPFSPYSHAKALGETVTLAVGTSGTTVVYRPQSVHGAERPTTRSLARLASSPAATVAGHGERPTPQALVANVGDAAAFLALCSEQPPPRVVHPWEGVTTSQLLAWVGGRPPRQVPEALAHALVWGAREVGRAGGRWSAYARRLELMWFGQGVAESWLSTAGWSPPVGSDGWRELAHRVHNHDSPIGRQERL